MATTANRNRADTRRAVVAWEALMRTHATMMAHFAADDIWSPITLTEYDVLYAIETAGCTVRASDLRDAVLVSQPTLSRTVERLRERGLIERVADPVDGRASLLSLTAAGRAARGEVGRKHAAAITRRLAAALDSDQLDTLTHLLTLIAEANPR